MGFLTSWQSTAIAAGLAAVFFWLYVGAKSDLKAEIESCNTRIAELAVDAEREAGIAREKALQRQIAELEAINTAQTEALGIAAEAASEAARRPERVRTVIKEVASANACIDTVVPAAVVDSLRD
jgi:hypothetical protein